MPAILNQGETDIRNAVKDKVTHVGITDDDAAFGAAQTDLSPTVGKTDLIKTATKAEVDFQTEDYTISINGDSEFTNKSIMTIGACSGATSDKAMTRTVRGAGLGIGVQAGDLHTVGVRFKHEDNTP
jgi:hypothetical protein